MEFARKLDADSRNAFWHTDCEPGEKEFGELSERIKIFR